VSRSDSARGGPPVVELQGIAKSYGALRPLRIERLEVAPGEHVAIVGPDQPAAEVLIGLITGASLPDAGAVRVFGRSTAEITSGDEWLAGLDRFGIVSDRAALLEALTVLQNLAVPFSLDIEPPPEPVRVRAASLGAELLLDSAVHAARAGDLDGAGRLRLRVARALAFDPALVLLEHPSASVPPGEVAIVARDIRAALVARRAASLTVTADRAFAAAIAGRVLVLDAASGRLKPR
jgi:ABC-type transporter Mla maintaining outer membrane lipid asymmetry ATPase subunit MlaF